MDQLIALVKSNLDPSTPLISLPFLEAQARDLRMAAVRWGAGRALDFKGAGISELEVQQGGGQGVSYVQHRSRM